MKLWTCVIPIAISVSGCSATFDMQVMPRDSGKMYSGWLYGAGNGTGSAEITIDGITYAGPAVRSSSPESVALTSITTLGPIYPKTSSAVTVADSGANVGVKALLRSSEGRGMRCDLQGRPHGGTGICIDDSGRIFDVIMSRR